MAKKPETKPEKPKETTCFRCDGTGQLCEGCGESESICDGLCDEEVAAFSHYDCPDCNGTGK